MTKSKTQRLKELSEANPGMAVCLTEDIKPIDLESLPVEQRAMFDALARKHEETEAQNPGGVITLNYEDVEAEKRKIDEAERLSHDLTTCAIADTGEAALSVVVDLSPEAFTVEALCVMELIYEAFSRGEITLNSSNENVEIDQKKLSERIKKKKRKAKRDGRLTTSIPAGGMTVRI